MPKKSTKMILAALKRAGISSEDLDKVQNEIDDLDLDAEEFLGSDKIILSKEDHREIKDDLTKLRQRAKDAEAAHKDLQDAVDAGDSDNARKATTYKKTLDEQKPIMEKLLAAQTAAWDAQAGTIPEKIKGEFRVPEEGKELTVDDLVHNSGKLEEYTRIGVLGEGPEPDVDPAPGPPNAPRVQPKPGPAPKFTTDQLDAMNTSAMVESGYAPKK